MAGQISSCTVLSSAVCRQPGSVVESLRGSTPAHPVCRKVRRRGGCTVVAAVNEGGEEKAARKKGLFSFVTDNDSSRGAIQLPNTPAQDGNLGQMISVRPSVSSFLPILIAGFIMKPCRFWLLGRKSRPDDSSASLSLSFSSMLGSLLHPV